MLNGKTRSVTAFAATLLGTTFLVNTSEAHANSALNNTNNTIGQTANNANKKHFVKSARYKKNHMRRKHARKKHPVIHRVAKAPQHTVVAAIAKKPQNPVNRVVKKSQPVTTRMVANPEFVIDLETETKVEKIVTSVASEQVSTEPRTTNTQRRATPRVAAAEKLSEPARCGFLFFSTDCGNDTTPYSQRQNPSPWFGTFVTSSVMERAESMVGMTARGNRRDLVKLFTDTIEKTVDPVRTPWCAAWANAVLAKEGIKGTDSLLARSFLDWGSITNNPEKGDVVVLARGGKRSMSGHVGFLVERAEVNGRRYVKVLGGNTGKSVQMSWYPESKVLGYRKVS